MSRRKKIVKDDIERSRIPPKLEVPEEYILTKDINRNLKKGMSVSKEKYSELINNGLGDWFK